MLHGMGIAITTTRHLQAGGGDGHALLPSSPFTSLASVSLKAGISPAPIYSLGGAGWGRVSLFLHQPYRLPCRRAARYSPVAHFKLDTGGAWVQLYSGPAAVCLTWPA